MSSDVCYNAKFDLEYVLDTSGSIDPSEFLKLKKFIHDLCDHLHIDESYVRIGIVKFSGTGMERIDLTFDEGTDKDWILDYTDPDNTNGLQQYTRRQTDLAPGLELAYEELYENNDRNKDKCVLILTDGQTQDPASDIEWAKKIKDDDGIVFGIGVGLTTSSAAHIEGLCTEPEFFYNVDSFDDLDDIVDTLSDQFPCGVNPFIQLLILLPLLLGPICCLCCLLALLGGIALCCLFAFKYTPKAGGDALLAPVPPVLDDIDPVAAPVAAGIPPPIVKKGGETTESMYYIGGQQTAVNWGNDGINWDTAYRPGDMGMGDGFGKKVGANKNLNENLLKKKKVPPPRPPTKPFESFEDDIQDENVSRYSKNYGQKKRKWCFLL